MTGAKRHSVLISLAVMSATVMQVLDTTIVNVALPHMQGELAATPDQITWILTTYLVASGVFMPLTGYFTDRMGQKRYLLASIIGFVIASGLCGIATNLTEIVVFRTLQGVFGAALVPLSQSIMIQTFPPDQRGRAMAIWGVGVMVGPILGPTLGGYLTEALNWRWTFFINLPVGVLSVLLAAWTVPDTPRRAREMDWPGLIFMMLAVGGLQFMLDRGNRYDWFASPMIQITAAISLVGFLGFVIHSFTPREHHLFNLKIFLDRNFATSSLLLMLFGLGLFGALVLQPLMFESLLGYPASTAGWLMAPRGAASMISMMVMGRFVGRVPPRNLVTVGIILCTVGSYAMTGYTLEISIWHLIWPAILQGLGLGMIFVPLSAVAFATLPKQSVAEATGIYSLMRTIGSSIGISITALIYARESQVAWNEIGSNIQPFNPALPSYLDRLGLTISDPNAIVILAGELRRQAQMVGLLDAFSLITWSFVLMLPLALVLRRVGTPAGASAPVAD